MAPLASLSDSLSFGVFGVRDSPLRDCPRNGFDVSTCQPSSRIFRTVNATSRLVKGFMINFLIPIELAVSADVVALNPVQRIIGISGLTLRIFSDNWVPVMIGMV